MSQFTEKEGLVFCKIVFEDDKDCQTCNFN